MSDKIKELRERAKKLETEARGALDQVKDDTPKDKAKELNDQFDTLMDQRDKLVAQADREERADKAKRESEARQEECEREERNARRPGQGEERHTPEGDVSEEYREAFRSFLACGADVSAMDNEAREVLRAGAVELRSQSTGTGPAGGYTVPTTLAAAINVAMAAHGPMMDEAIATEINLPGGAPFVIPTVDDTDEEAAAHTEGGTPADDNSGDIALGKATLVAHTMITPWIKWSYELAQDSSFSFESLLAKLIGERLGRKGNKWLTVGTGVNEPLGFVTAAPVGKAAAATSLITFDEVMDLEHSIDPAYRGGPKVRFQMHDQTVKALRKLKNTNDEYIWSDGDVTKGVPATLLNKPVSFNQAMDQIGAGNKPIGFGDFSEYYTRKSGSPLIGVAREKFFPNLGIAGVHRIDGAPGQAKAIKTLQMAAA